MYSSLNTSLRKSLKIAAVTLAVLGSVGCYRGPISYAQTSNVASFVEGDFWSTGTGRFGSRAAFVSGKAQIIADALPGADTLYLDNTSVFQPGVFVEIVDGATTIHAADIVSISRNSIRLNRPLGTRINAGLMVEKSTPVDPRGAIQLGRNIPARRHSLIRMYRAGEERARLGLDESDNLAIMAGGSDQPALVVEKNGYIRLASATAGIPRPSDCNEPQEYFRITANHNALFICTNGGWKSTPLAKP